MDDGAVYAVYAEAARLSAAMTAGIGVRTIDLPHASVVHHSAASGLVSLDRRQCAAARACGLDVVEL